MTAKPPLPEVSIQVALPPTDDHVTVVYRKPYMDTPSAFAYVVTTVDKLPEVRRELRDAQERGYNPFQVDGPRPLPDGVVDLSKRRKQ